MTGNVPALVVLAAGMGSRYGGLKQIVPVNAAGEAIVDYSVYDALRAGIDRVVFVIRRQIEDAFRAAIGSRFERHADVSYAFQELDGLPPGFAAPQGRTKPWGTLHAALTGAEMVSGAFAVINADDFYGAAGYGRLVRHLQGSSLNSAMVGFPLRNTLSDFGPVSRGVCSVDAEGTLQSTVERTNIVREGNGARSLEAEGPGTALTGDEIASMNMWGFRAEIVPALRESFIHFLQHHGSSPNAESYLPAAVNDIVSTGRARVQVLQTRDEWCGITYPQDYAHVAAHIARLTRQGIYPETLWT